jgi:hypothetical protein
MVKLFSEDVSGMQIPTVNANSSIYPDYGIYDNNAQQEDVLSSDFIPDPSIQQPFSFQPMMANQPPSSIVGGMFSPEISRAAQMEYMQKRQAAMQERAMAFAQLSPMQQADYGFYRGGQQLGDALGGALGGTDPQLQKIGLQQQILSELDPSKPEQNLMIAQKYARVAPELAMRIANEARTALVRIKQAQGATRQGVTAKIQVAERIATDEGLTGDAFKQRVAKLLQSSDNLSEAERKGARVAEITRLLNVGDGGIPFSQKERAALEAELATYERPDKQLSLTNDRDAISAELFENKPFAEITPAQKAIVNKRVEEEGQARAKASAVLLPGQPAAPKDWLAFSSQISKDPVMDRTSTILADAPSAIETIRMSTTNDIAAASLPGSLARLTGEGKNMSNQDVNRFARTGGLDDRLAQDAVGFFTGRKTNVTKEQAERFATAVYRGALLERKKFIKAQAEQAGYDKTPNYDIAIRQLDDQLNQFKLVKPSDKKTEQPKQTVSDDALINKYLPKKP